MFPKLSIRGFSLPMMEQSHYTRCITRVLIECNSSHILRQNEFINQVDGIHFCTWTHEFTIMDGCLYAPRSVQPLRGLLIVPFEMVRMQYSAHVTCIDQRIVKHNNKFGDY